MEKFLAGVLVGAAVAVAVNETLKSEKIKDAIDLGKSKVGDLIEALMEKIDPGVSH